MNRKESERFDESDVLLGKLAAGELSDGEERRLRRLMEQNPDVNGRAAGIEGMAHRVRIAQGDAFAPGFAQRVMDRVYPEADRSSFIAASFLARLFARLAPVALALALIAGVYNYATTDADSPFDAVLGIESVTAATAYEDALTMW